MERIYATYWIETAHEVEVAASAMAGEQSCGTFLKVPGETKELRKKFSAVVENIEILNEKIAPSLPGASVPKGEQNPIWKQAQITLSWPFHNMGANLPNLMATIAGNLFELNQFSGLRLKDISFSESFFKKYKGTKFGIDGTYNLLGFQNRPVIGTIIKPSVGLSPEETANQTQALLEAGIDFFKDDELMGDPPHSVFERRVDAVMECINDHALRTGKKAMFAFNISGDIDDMFRRHDYVLQKGGTCIMASLNWIGLSALAKLNEHTQLPIHGHRNGWGLFYRSPHIGIDYKALQKIWRLAGADHLHTNGIRNKFCETDDSVIASIKACQKEENGKSVMPVISSGQWAGQAVDTYNAIGNTDLMYVAGGGIVGHPSGAAAGVRSIKQAWEAAVAGISLEAYAKEHKELSKALQFFVKHVSK